MENLKDYFLKFLEPSVLITTLVLLFGASLAYGSLTSRVNAVEDRQDRQGTIVQNISRDEQAITDLMNSVNRIDNNVSLLVKKLIGPIP